MVSSTHISVIHIELSYWLNVSCWLSSALIYVKTFVDLVFPLRLCDKNLNRKQKMEFDLLIWLVQDELVFRRI